MEEKQDIRWQQRFSNYKKALKHLAIGIELLDTKTNIPGIMDIVNDGLIQRFEFTHELAWNVMKDYAAFQGNYEIRGSRDAIRYALKENLITDEKWMSTINARNLTSHDYNEDTATQIAKDIRNVYFKLFCDFADKMESLLCTD
ncbi:MAG: nucleotidyltransferase substrate binding protein [Bacteroidales bacterium]|nr:nucleotidyltransferase substrate binding protein [Bacteroidales bacterium]